MAEEWETEPEDTTKDQSDTSVFVVDASILSSRDFIIVSNSSTSDLSITNSEYEGIIILICYRNTYWPYNNITYIFYIGSSSHEELSFAKFLQEKFPVAPMLLTATGLPNCGRRKIIIQSLKVTDLDGNESGEDTQLSSYHTMMGNSKHEQVKEEKGILLALQAALMYGDMMPPKNVEIKDEKINKFVQSTFKILETRQKEYAKSRKGKADKRLHDLEKSLHHGISLMTIWDMPIGGHYRPILESLSKLLTRNFMLLFASLDRDVSKLEFPPTAYTDTADTTSLKWKSRVEYLLRTSQLAMNSKLKETDKVCKIVASYTSANSQPKDMVKILERECKNAAVQLGLAQAIESEVVSVAYPLDSEGKKAIENQISMFRRKNIEEKIPLSWLLLRCYLFEYSGFYITRHELANMASFFHINKMDLNRFCDFFSSFGSIFDLQKIEPTSEYVIINPIAFFSAVDRLYQQSSANVDAIQTGRVLPQEDKTMAVVLEVLATLSIALKYENQLSQEVLYYHMPSLRKGKCNTSCSNNAVRLILDLQSPRINIATGIMKELLNDKESEIDLSLDLNTEHSNTIKLRNKQFQFTITFQGDITEIEFLKPHEHSGEMHLKIIRKIIHACKEMVSEYSNRVPSTISCYFAIRCCDDKAPNNVSLNLHRKQHTLPIKGRFSDFCSSCTERKPEVVKVAKYWSQELAKVLYLRLL